MKILAEIFYLIIIGLIKIGDAVIFTLTAPGGAIIHFHKPLLAYIKNIKLPKKHLKKKGVLFKSRKQKPNITLSISKPTTKLFLQSMAISFMVLKRIGQTLWRMLYEILLLPALLLKLLWEITRSILKGIAKTGKAFVKPFISIRHAFAPKKKRTKKAAGKPTFWYSFKVFFWGMVFSALFIFLPLVTLMFLTDLPNPAKLATNYIPKTTKIYDRNGILLYEIFANQNRSLVKLDEIPQQLKQATIAIEDKDFYTHPGFDLKGIARAAYSNFTSDDFQGGSTITQQLIKSALLSPEPTITRKVKEVILAFWAERTYSKDEILEMYFNFVPYGGTAWGVQAASEVYFGKDVRNLTLSESAFLAGLPRAPSVYSPYSQNPTLWKQRQKQVLDAMVKMNYISPEQAEKAASENLAFVGPQVNIKAPHFVMYVKNLLVQKYGLSEVERGGLQVITSLDSKTQQMTQQIVSEEVANDASLNISNGASLVLDPRNGDILAMIGSRNYFDRDIDGNVNLTTSLRQPGSTIKVVTYSLALGSGFTEASLLDDSPLTITPAQGPSYTPVNYDGRSHGRVPLRIAFANSYNITAVRVAQKLGVAQIVEHGKKLGITTWNDPDRYGVSITLGGAETTMVDLATVYATVANGGKKVVPDPILEIKDSYGNMLYQKAPEESEILDPGVAFIVSDILADNKARTASFGPNSPLNIPSRRVSVKTGTTDSKRDNWTVGFTPSVVVATWVGNNDNSPMSQSLTSGISGAAPMWNKIMTGILANMKEEPIIIPENIVKKNCFGREVYFLQGTQQQRCTAPPSTTPSPGQTALAH